jgi:threonine/homoserine/homoserine lactone efflux protein
MWFFIKGLILGFSIAAPVGPIAVLCIRKTLQYGRFSGLFSGLGAAVADMIYGMIGAFGLTLISNALISGQFWLKLLGGTFLIYLGVKTFLSKGKISKEHNVSHTTLLKDFVSTFFLTMTNPMTILSFAAVFAGAGLSKGNSNLSTFLMVLGIFFGSALWWLALSEFVTLFRKKIEEKMMIWINRGAGLIIMIFGLIALISIIFSR